MGNSWCSKVAVLFVVSFGFLTPGFANARTGAAENPNGEPPFGVAIQRDAQGEKLVGVLFAEFFNNTKEWNGSGFSYFADARVVVRLRKGAGFAVFYGEVAHVDITTPKVAQPVLVNTVAEDVLAHFFPGDQGLSITLKSMTDYGQLDLCEPLTADFNNCQPEGTFGTIFFAGNTVVLADIVLAIK